MKLIGVILLSLAAMSASAEIYRWKDANGNWQFGDKAPQNQPNSQHETIDVKPPPMIGQDEAQDIHARTQRLLESQQAQARHKAQVEEKKREEHRKRFSKRCEEAEERLERMNRPFVYVDEDGTRRDASAAEVIADQRKTQKWIEEHCDF